MKGTNIYTNLLIADSVYDSIFMNQHAKNQTLLGQSTCLHYRCHHLYLQLTYNMDSIAILWVSFHENGFLQPDKYSNVIELHFKGYTLQLIEYHVHRDSRVLGWWGEGGLGGGESINKIKCQAKVELLEKSFKQKNVFLKFYRCRAQAWCAPT